MSDAIIWLVLWALATVIGTWAIYAFFGLLSVGLATFFNKVWLAPIGVALGFVLALSWFVFAAYNTIMQIVSVVQIASGVAG